MQHEACDVWLGPQIGITHNVDIRESGKAKRIADAATAGAFNVKEEFGLRSKSQTRVKRCDTGERVFSYVLQTLGAAIESGKIAVGLEDEIHLSRNPESLARVREDA